MVKNLRKRITVIFSILSASVLLFVLVLSYKSAQSSALDAHSRLFLNLHNTIWQQAVMNGSITSDFVTQQKNDNRIVFYIEDNDMALELSGFESDSEEIKFAKDMALSLGVNFENEEKSSSLLAEFITSVIDGKQYRAIVQLGLGSNGNWIKIISLQDRTSEHESLNKLYLFYIGLALTGTFLLIIISWFLSGIAAKPTEETMRVQKEFIAAASHEIKSPLAVIKSSLSAMERKPSEREHFTRVVDKEIDRLSRLTNELLALSSTDLASWKLYKAPLNIDTLLLNLYESFLPLASDKKQKLSVSLPEETLPIISADEERVAQVISIFINNALSHTPPGTNVTIGADVVANKISIFVADDGEGIPEGEREKVFSRFYRMDKSRESKSHLGLGLSLAKEIAKMHGAEVLLKETSGGGATFILKLSMDI